MVHNQNPSIPYGPDSGYILPLQFVLKLLHLTIGATESGVASPFKLLGIVVPKLVSAFTHWVECVFSALKCVRDCIL